MKSSVNERIRLLIAKLGVSDNQFAKTIGVTQSVISSMFARGTEPSSKVVSAILNAYAYVSAEWLLRGKGKMFKYENCEEPVIVYHYTSLKGLFGIMGSRELLLSPTRDSNDMWERNTGGDYYRCSFCAGDKAYLKSRMWAQYGSTHKGVCIAFRLDTLKRKFESGTDSFFVKYKDADELKLLPDEEKIHYKESDWESENEYRIVSKIQKSIPIDLDCIKNVYVGIDAESMIDKLEKIGINRKLVGFMSSNLGTIAVSPLKYWKIDTSWNDEYEVDGLNIKRYTMKPEVEDVPEPESIENAREYYEELSMERTTPMGSDEEERATSQGGIIIPISNPKAPEKILPLSEFNLYDIDVSAGLSKLFSEDGDKIKAFLGKISIPNMPRCDGAVKVIGDSMYPLLKSGDIIAYKEVHNIESVQWGEIYILQLEYDTDISVVVKYVKKSDKGNEYINLVSYNKEHDPKDVKKENITAMARVMVCIRQMSII